MNTNRHVPCLLFAAAFLCSVLILGTGCSQETADTSRAAPGETAAMSDDATEGPELAVAELSPTQGHNVRGTVRFLREGSSVRVVADITGLSAGEHGFHIHETGDCSAPDATSAGAHFNPTGDPHGARNHARRHAGDLGNLTADENGRARIDFVDAGIELHGPHSIINRAVIVHEKPDDLTSQPSGNAGARVACGVIQAQ